MTAYAKMLFFVNKPALDNKVAFSNNCPNGTDQSYVIGCYHSGDRGIFLLNVTDQRLNGIVPVTAAYEMLHAGYARLSATERTKIDRQMWSYYLSNVKSSEIHQQMASYALTEPGAKYDELYSVLATEVSNLPSTLNDQYKQYFTNRTKIVSMYQGYQAAFSKRQIIIDMDNSLLNSLKVKIASNETLLNSMYAQIIKDQSVLNQEKANNDINSYNSGVYAYNTSANKYNALISLTKSDIIKYNRLAEYRNSLVLIEQQLIRDLNTSNLPSKVK